MCQCNPRMVVCASDALYVASWIPHDKSLVHRTTVYWTYLHKDGGVQVKRWMCPASYEHDCDLCHALEQQKEGNDFIVKVFPWPFILSPNWNHRAIGQKLFDSLMLGNYTNDSIYRFDDLVEE